MKENSKPSIKTLQDDKTRLEKELEAVRAIQEETPKEWRIIKQENGSLIGYNAYAMSIKADYEKPSQTFFLIHPRYGKTIVAPIELT